MGSELYAHFSVKGDRLESQELQELAEDAGAAEVPGGGGEGAVVARLDAASKAQRREETELWVDSTKLHFFDPESGRSLSENA
jgi:multiple sugar transport system ATP-binding protein